MPKKKTNKRNPSGKPVLTKPPKRGYMQKQLANHRKNLKYGGRGKRSY